MMSSRTLPAEQQQKFAVLEQRARDFQQKYEEMIESFTVASLPLQRQAFECCVHCFDNNGGEAGAQQQQQTTTSSSRGGWSRLFKSAASADASAAGNSFSSLSATTPAFDAEKRGGGEKIHERITRCISGCHTKGEHVSRAVQQELDVLQSKLESCQKVCYSRLADETQRHTAKHPDAGSPPFTDNAEKCFVQCFSDAEPLMKEISTRIHKRIKDTI